MRFAKLEVENFKAIASAKLEFGPGLNVLYGPNDLGKSTLGVALRAALLLPSTSSHAHQFVPWQEPVAPVVTLTFLTEVSKYWRVRKRFTQNEATLSFSKDGKEFSVDAHERVVDERLRKLLGWGLPSPGGRGGAKGMPESFLANALLAAQTDVEGILQNTIADDPEPSGRLKLTAALSALAQDPLVRHVLDAAQKEHELHFTTTGRKKSGHNAPLSQASERVKQLTDELMVQQQALSQTAALEQESGRLHDAWLEAQQRAQEAERSLARAQAGLTRANEKRAAEEKLSLERRALAQVDALAERLEVLDEELFGLSTAVKEKEARLETTQQGVKAATEQVRAAEEALRRASSADGAAERAVARATLKEEQAQRSVQKAELTARLEKAQAAARAAGERARLTETRRKVTEQLGPARAKWAEAKVEAEQTGALVSYGHWRVAGEAARFASQWRAEAKRLRAEALGKSTESLKQQREAKALDDEVVARRESLPDEKQRAAFTKLRRECELADAALGGGVTVVVRPKSQLILRSTADENELEERPRQLKELSIEADRRVQLAIGDLVEIEVIAGAAEKRKDADHLRKKWREQVLPALERASVRNLSELNELFTELDERLARAKMLSESATAQEREAETIRNRATMLEEKASGAPSAEQLEEKLALVGPFPLEALAQLFESLGPSWESQARPLHEQKARALEETTALVSRLEGELKLTELRLADAQQQAPGEVEEAGLVEKALAALERALEQGAQRLNLLEPQGSDAMKRATSMLEEARARLEQAEAALAVANDGLTEARAAQSSRSGERDATRAQLEAAGRPMVLSQVQRAEQQLATFSEVEVLSAAQLAERERTVELSRLAAEQAGRDFAAAEGALSKVGGPQARENVRQLEEALRVARAREQLIEVDAAGWKLLVEAVSEAEKEDSSSLGTALAGPVSERFAELTKGRYPSVKFDPTLTATGVEVPGTQASSSDILKALSVGTRDHLATLVRLAIALQLKSTIVLDDHLVHTDLGRLEWFREALRAAATQIQVVVLTCRPLDYVPAEALPTNAAFTMFGETRVVDLSRVIERRFAARADSVVPHPAAPGA